MYSSPCLNHDACPLDLEKLVAELHALRARSAAGAALWKNVEAARDTLRAAPKDPTAKAAFDAAWAALREHSRSCSPEYATLLYSIRAHHRGRIHRLWERTPTGEVKSLTLEDQARRIEQAKVTLEKFLREPTPKTS